MAIVVLAACGEDKHSLPVVEQRSDDPGQRLTVPSVPAPAPAEPPKLDLDSAGGRLRALFGATQGPDLASQRAKFAELRAKLPPTQRPLVDRAEAILQAGELARGTADRAKANQLQLQVLRDTLALLDDMVAAAPDDLETGVMVASSLKVTADNIEASGFAEAIPPSAVRAKARQLATALIEKHPTAARAWAIHASVTPYSEPEARLRSFARCAKLDPTAKAYCQEPLEAERIDYVRPYCEGADKKPIALEWREVSRQPIRGAATITYHYETYYVAASPRLTFQDVARVRAEESRTDMHQLDGKVTQRVDPSVRLELAPGKLAELVAWSRDVEKRGGGIALFQGDKLLYIDERAMWEDSTPGINGVTIDAFCAKTKTRTLPLLD